MSQETFIRRQFCIKWISVAWQEWIVQKKNEKVLNCLRALPAKTNGFFICTLCNFCFSCIGSPLSDKAKKVNMLLLLIF